MKARNLAGLVLGLSVAGCTTQEYAAADKEAISMVQTSGPGHKAGGERIVTSPLYKKPVQSHQVPDNITGGQVQVVDNEQAEYLSEFKIIHQGVYSARPNARALPGEDSWMLQRWDDLELVRDDRAKESRLESGAFYIPQRVLNSEGNAATRISMGVGGQYGMAAIINNFKAQGVALGIATLTHEDIAYNITTLIVGEGDFAKEYFFPKVEESQIDRKEKPDRLNFYLMPVEGTLIRAKLQDGRIILENREGVIRRPVRVEKEDYEHRPFSSLYIKPGESMPGNAGGLEFEAIPLDFSSEGLHTEGIR